MEEIKRSFTPGEIKEFWRKRWRQQSLALFVLLPGVLIAGYLSLLFGEKVLSLPLKHPDKNSLAAAGFLLLLIIPFTFLIVLIRGQFVYGYSLENGTLKLLKTSPIGSNSTASISSDKIEKIKYQKQAYGNFPKIWLHLNSPNKGSQSYIFISEEITENLIKELGVEVF